MIGDMFANLPEAEAIIAGDLQRELPQSAPDVLLSVVLAWANLDMATAFFLASVSGVNPDTGAEKFGRKEIADKLKKAVKALEADGEFAMASEVKAIAEIYPEKALFRRRIAHSKCAGVRASDPERFVFMPIEREGPVGHLAIEVIHTAKFAEALSWAQSVHDRFMAYVDAADFFQKS